MSRLFDFFKGLLAMIVVLALLVGVPALLLVIVGFPLPTEMPNLTTIQNHINDGDIPDLFVIKALTCVVWIVWIQLAVALLTEMFAVIRGRTAGRAPVLPAVQLFSRKLVASTVLVISALAPAKTVAAAPLVPIDASEIAPVAAGPSESVINYSMGGESLSFADLGDQAKSPKAIGQYKTTESDNWWDMAERLLGDGMRWSELRDLNQGRTMLTGETISDRTETVHAGWNLDVPPDANAGLLGTYDEGVVADALPAEAQEASRSNGAEQEAGSQAPALQDTVQGDARDASGSSPLIDAIKPYTLVYEGPSGAVDAGPGVPYQVVEGDNLWDIAERHLGDPFRWPEIFENSNDLQQSFGRKITDPNLIWPESIVWLPSDAVDVPPADPALVAEVLGPLTPVESGSEHGRNGVIPDDLEQVSAGADVNGDALGGPDGGGRRAVPVDRPIRAVENENLPVDEKSLADVVASPPGMAFGMGGLFVATGLLGMLHRARRLRLTQAEERSIPAPPPMELIDIETVLRNSADGRRALSVHSAIRSLADRPIVVGEPMMAPEVVRMSGDRIEVVQQGPDPDLPAPWMSAERPDADGSGSRFSAVLPAEFFPDEAEDDRYLEVAAPTMVTVGGGLLLNLETVGVVSIDGPVEVAAGLVRSMVHELATSPARRSLDIRVSNWLPGADLHEQVQCSPLDNLVGELQPWLEDVELGLTASGGYSAYALRAAGQGASLPGAKVIFADATDAPAIAPLIDYARRHTLPLAVVFSGDLSDTSVQPTTTIKLDAETMELEPYGFTAAMQYLDVDLVLGTEALIQHARQAPMIHRDNEQETILPLSDIDTDPANVATEETPEGEIATELPVESHEITDQAEDEESGILIRVMGSVEFEGAPENLNEEERSILTLLAVVGPSTAAQIQDSVWPDQAVGENYWNSVIAGLSDKLGHQFPDSGDGRYRVRSIITDLGSARRWIAQAETMSDERATNLMQLALSDVRGPAFSGVDDHHWQWIHDHKMALATQATALLIDACFDLCDLAYESDDLHLAKWACDVGALIDPLHETMAIRRVQLMGALDLHTEAEAAVEQWENAYRATTGQQAPDSARAALTAGVEAAVPYVG